MHTTGVSGAASFAPRAIGKLHPTAEYFWERRKVLGLNDLRAWTANSPLFPAPPVTIPSRGSTALISLITRNGLIGLASETVFPSSSASHFSLRSLISRYLGCPL